MSKLHQSITCKNKRQETHITRTDSKKLPLIKRYTPKELSNENVEKRLNIIMCHNRKLSSIKEDKKYKSLVDTLQRSNYIIETKRDNYNQMRDKLQSVINNIDNNIDNEEQFVNEPVDSDSLIKIIDDLQNIIEENEATRKRNNELYKTLMELMDDVQIKIETSHEEDIRLKKLEDSLMKREAQINDKQLELYEWNKILTINEKDIEERNITMQELENILIKN